MSYTFNYTSLENVEEKLKELGCGLPLSRDCSVLGTPIRFGPVSLKNRLWVASMEGVDSLPDGSPSELTRMRYLDLAKGGAGLIWFEAVSVVQEGRSSLKQLYLCRETLPAFQKLVAEVKAVGKEANGFEPYLVMQANHSGRYSRPNAGAKPEPIIAFHRPQHEAAAPVDDSRIATDDYLERLEETFGQAARLCKEAGFDAMDVKSCHGYLFDEFASAYTREGKYGGSFENRFRLLINSVKNAKREEEASFTVVCRLGIYDGFPYPHGFGMAADGSLTPDFNEPVRLVGILHKQLGMPFINLTMGDPHKNFHVTRPYDRDKLAVPPEHPFVSLSRMYEGCGVIKKAYPSLGVAASAPSYMRQFAPNLAAGAVLGGICDAVCFGRLSFANRNFANEIMETGTLEKNHTCLTCGKCSEMIRAGVPTGCLIRNFGVYREYYQSIE